MKPYRFISLGDNVDTDIIISGRYLRTTDFSVWKDHVFEAIDPQIAGILSPNYVIIAGHNFGCGSSREQAAWAIKNTGIATLIAKSFARIFFRNAINIGLNLILAPTHTIDEQTNEAIYLDTEKNRIICGKRKYSTVSYPTFINEIIKNNGLINYYNNTHEKK